jgi:hypothetical protein
MALAERNTTDQIRELTVGEVDAVTGAGFFGDIWDTISDTVAEAVDSVFDCFFRR